MRKILKNQIDLTYPRHVTYHICENYSFFYYAVWGCAYYYKDGKHSCKIQLSLIQN